MTATSACWRATLIAVALIGALMMLPKPLAAEMPPALYKLGLPAAAGAVAVTVSSAEITPAGQEPRLVVGYTIKNISFDPVPPDSLPGLRLLDPEGGFHDPVEPPAGDSAAAALEPGAELKRTVVFETKAGFDPRTWRLLVGGPRGPRVTLQ